ncbi:MAG: Ig-like domain-containing protein [bacterium]|nr:Ig-like domain-containing protein [bacterium]
MKDHLFRILALALVLTLIGAGCLTSSSDDDDATIPSVSFTNLIDGDMIFTLTPEILIQFSEAMNESSVESALTLSTATREDVLLDFVWEGRNLVFEPRNPLDYGTDYTVTIGTGAQSDQGENLTTAWTIAFNTLLSTPMVKSTLPDDGAPDIGLNTNVTVKFSMDMEEISTEAAISILPSVPFEADIADEDDVLTITFTTPLTAETEYTITVDETATSSMGANPMAEDYVFSFTTGSMIDDTPPSIEAFSPRNGSANVARDISIMTITFSEPINPETFSPSWIDYRLEKLIPGEPVFSADNRVLTVPLQNLPPGITLAVDFGPFSDLAGNVSEDPVPYSFTVAGTPSWFPNGTNDWWELYGERYDGHFSEEIEFLWQVENKSGNNFDVSRYEKPDFGLENRTDPPADYTELSDTWHYTYTGDDLYVRGWSEFDDEDVWQAQMFDTPVLWLQLPATVGDEWQQVATTTMDGVTARITANFSVVEIGDFPSDAGPYVREEDMDSDFADCVVIRMEFAIHALIEEAWEVQVEGIRDTWYCEGVGIVFMFEESTDYEEGVAQPTDTEITELAPIIIIDGLDEDVFPYQSYSTYE